ncbi:MAG: YceD family protein [Georgfuchsia sp.]
MQLMQMVIDGAEFARHGNRASGSVAVADLSRVAEYLANSDGMLDCVVQGASSDEDSGHLELRLTIGGELQLRCQRCLEAMWFPLRLDKCLWLVMPGAEWPEEEVEDEGFDAIEASEEMALGSLIEDEILLALPISPRHEICGTPKRKDTKQDASPFAVLRKLKID